MMNNRLLSIILICVFLFLNIPLIISLVQIKKNGYKVNHCMGDINSLGFSISVNGAIRVGKSSTVSGIVNIIENKMLCDIQNEMDKCKNIFHYLDFNFIDKFLKLEFSKYDKISFHNRKNVFDYLISYLKLKNGIYNDFINNKSLYELLYIYVDNFYILHFRKCFVIAKNAMYSFVTSSFCTYLLDETLELKEVYLKKCFYLERYIVCVYDEKSLSRGNLKSLLKTVDRDKGRKELTALCGQIFEETTFFISVKQVSSDEEVSERRLCVSNLLIKDRHITNNLYSAILPFLSFQKANYILTGIFYWLTLKKFKYKNFKRYVESDKSKYRFRKLRLQHYIDYIRSLAVVNVLVYNYDNANDVGKKNDDLYKKMIFAFPINKCIGNYNTHDFSFLLEELSKMSNISFQDVPRVGFFKSKKIKKNMSNFLYERKNVNE